MLFVYTLFIFISFIVILFIYFKKSKLAKTFLSFCFYFILIDQMEMSNTNRMLYDDPIPAEYKDMQGLQDSEEMLVGM